MSSTPAASVLVALMTPIYFNDFVGNYSCKLHGQPLQCTYVWSSSDMHAQADALLYHAPDVWKNKLGKPVKHHPEQLAVMFSMESDRYYPVLADAAAMQHYDVEMSYRTCSQVPIMYFDYHFFEQTNMAPAARPSVRELFVHPVPFQSKKRAIAYVNSNCDAPSGRNAIVKQLMALPGADVPVHSWGHCERNMAAPATFHKVDVIRDYLFCIAMENSLSKDYLTEKLWEALLAGCVPVYMGAHNYRDFVPHPSSVINYADFGSPEKLAAELSRLANDELAYSKHLAWKRMPWHMLSPGFLSGLQQAYTHRWHTRCQLCRLVAAHRLKPTERFTTCLFNQTWMATYQGQ